MKYYIPLLLGAFVCSFLSAPMLLAQECDAQTFDEFYAKAEASRKKAASVGGEWYMGSIPKPLALAKAQAKKNHWVKACELAIMVDQWGKGGYKQAISQKNAGPRFKSSSTAAVKCNKNTYVQFVEKAKASQKLAASVGGEWYMSSLPKPMADADRAAKKRKFDRACELVQMVDFWGQAGFQQAMSQLNAGPRF